MLTDSGALIGITSFGYPSLYKFKFNKMSVLHSFPTATTPGAPVIGRDSLIYGVDGQGGIAPCTVFGTTSSIFGCGFLYSFDRQQLLGSPIAGS